MPYTITYDSRRHDDVITRDGIEEPLTPLTPPQRHALMDLHRLHHDVLTWADMRRAVRPAIGCGDTVLVIHDHLSMAYGIEPDGTTHT